MAFGKFYVSTERLSELKLKASTTVAQEVIVTTPFFTKLMIQQLGSPSTEQTKQEALNILAETKHPEGSTFGPKWFVQGKYEKYDPVTFQSKQGARLYKLDNNNFINWDDIELLKRIKPSASTSSSRETKTEILLKKAKTPSIQKRSSPSDEKKTFP